MEVEGNTIWHRCNLLKYFLINEPEPLPFSPYVFTFHLSKSETRSFLQIPDTDLTEILSLG